MWQDFSSLTAKPLQAISEKKTFSPSQRKPRPVSCLCEHLMKIVSFSYINFILCKFERKNLEHIVETSSFSDVLPALYI